MIRECSIYLLYFHCFNFFSLFGTKKEILLFSKKKEYRYKKKLQETGRIRYTDYGKSESANN